MKTMTWHVIGLAVVALALAACGGGGGGGGPLMDVVEGAEAIDGTGDVDAGDVPWDTKLDQGGDTHMDAGDVLWDTKLDLVPDEWDGSWTENNDWCDCTGKMCGDDGCGGSCGTCDDGNPCTNDACDDAGTCVFGPIEALCDDGDPCTVADTCVDGECVSGPVDPECTVCEPCPPPENLCEGYLVQDPETCECTFDPNTVVICPAHPEQCHAYVCNANTGMCEEAIAPDFEPCDDGEMCTVDDFCSAGSCQPGGPNLDDPACASCCDVGCPSDDQDKCNGNLVCNPDTCACEVDPDSILSCPETDSPCLLSFCNPQEGKCVAIPAPKGVACDDGKVCSVADACDGGGNCVGQGLECDDGNPCTLDTCDDAGGCVHEPANGAACDDGDVCTVADLCQDGMCIGTPVSCDDGNLCTSDMCDPAAGCMNVEPPVLCDDGNLCTLDGCDPATGLCAFVPKVCDDNDPTTTDYCDPVTGECKIAPVVCDDGNACTNEAYDPQTGGCLSLPVSCDDANPCTADSCNPASGCVNAPDDKGACGDNDKCNGIEYCQNGTCMPGEVPVCNNGNLCDVGACHPVNGCQYTPLLCDDGSICTLDSCDPKQGCLAVPDPAACNDQNPCTDDSCDLATGCVHQPNDKNSCGDNDKCNGIEYCQAGACVPGEAPVCDDGNPCTAGKCDPVQGCQYTPDNGGNCSDNNECNGMEFCQAGKCMPGVPLKCDDGNACTTDACTPGKGCGHTAVKDDTPCPGGSNYACLAGKCVCVPDCVGKACGDNGCGGSCGFCQGGSVCDNGQCVAPYTCSDMIACGSNCNFSPSCILGCYGKGSAASIGLFTAYGGCLAIACGLNIDPVCIAAASMGQCKSAYDACMADQ